MAHYGFDDEGPAVLGSLAATSSRLPRDFRSDPRWPPAVLEHAEKLLAMSPPPLVKLEGPLPDGIVPDRAFFTGQERDGSIRARLVVDNGECGHADDVVTNELPPMIERLALLSKIERLRADNLSWVVRAGDVSGAYYATKARGYLRLPKEWPKGTGNMYPLEVVQSNCAMPGSRLGSGLFLTQLDTCLPDFPRRYGCIREGSEFLGCNYSDDIIGIGSHESWSTLKEQISTQYSIEFVDGYPSRWVGMDFSMDDAVLTVSCYSSCERYECSHVKLPTQEAFALIQPKDQPTKSTDEAMIKDARTWVGRLNFAASLHPSLAFAATFLSSALHYLPEESIEMAQRIIHAVARFKPSFPILPLTGKYCVIYVDAAQDLPTCRATAGV